jgi:hypothetical protein
VAIIMLKGVPYDDPSQDQSTKSAQVEATAESDDEARAAKDSK